MEVLHVIVTTWWTMSDDVRGELHVRDELTLHLPCDFIALVQDHADRVGLCTLEFTFSKHHLNDDLVVWEPLLVKLAVSVRCSGGVANLGSASGVPLDQHERWPSTTLTQNRTDTFLRLVRNGDRSPLEPCPPRMQPGKVMRTHLYQPISHHADTDLFALEQFE